MGCPEVVFRSYMGTQCLPPQLGEAGAILVPIPQRRKLSFRGPQSSRLVAGCPPASSGHPR